MYAFLARALVSLSSRRAAHGATVVLALVEVLEEIDRRAQLGYVRAEFDQKVDEVRSELRREVQSLADAQRKLEIEWGHERESRRESREKSCLRRRSGLFLAFVVSLAEEIVTL